MYIFALGCLFSAHFLNPVFHNPEWTANEASATNSTISYDSLDRLATTFQTSPQPSAVLIFGDFITAGKFFFGFMTGQAITDALHLIPTISTDIFLLVRILFTFASACLWIFIIANRSL